ncbi:hypothetical protein L1987_53802 [Smallanthus sonchifolius]|uniref:Uncharacterized protein n=1 Tax=Smallanthus sonchifolius TaxID=185202 RepID=A0ACB9EXJ0_9ASTR|nr:hypothetical protein L1987_53802 [Smallanthus sonchifolius]
MLNTYTHELSYALSAEMRIFFSIVVLHATAMIHAQYDQSGFISIDCGSRSNYTQEGTGINYVSNEGFVEGSESRILPIHNDSVREYNTLRSFPKNKRNCYTLRPQKVKNHRYLIRAVFLYGNYDGKGQPPIFDLYMGADYWATILIPDPSEYLAHEMIHLTSSDYINVCLVNTGHGYPFITALELRLLDITMYKDQSRSLISVQRSNFGTTETVRDLSYNNLTGNVPEFLAQLDNLRILTSSKIKERVVMVEV